MKKIIMFLVLGLFLAGSASPLIGCRSKKPSAKIAAGHKKRAKKGAKRSDKRLKRQERSRH